MTTPTPLPSPTPVAPTFTVPAILTAITSLTALALTQGFITDKTAQLIGGLAAIVVPPAVLGILALVRLVGHHAASSAAATVQAAHITAAATPATYVLELDVEAAPSLPEQVREALAEVLATATKAPAPAILAATTPLTYAAPSPPVPRSV